MFDPSLGHTPNNQNLEIIKLLSGAKKEISKKLVKEESEKKLLELEKQITDLFPKDSLKLKEGHSFEKFAQKLINSNPSLKPHFSELFLHFKSPDEMVDFHLKTMDLANFKPELTLLLGKVSKSPEVGKLLVDKIDKKFTNAEDKKLAYQLLVSEFNIDTLDKFLSLKSESNQLFAIEAASYAAVENSYDLSCHIKSYGIIDEKNRIEIAEVGAQHGPISENIKNFDIKDEVALIQIAKNSAEIDPNFSKHIKKYEIKDEKARVEIAKIAAPRSGIGVSKDIQNYDIKDEEARIEIAKIAAFVSPANISQYIQNYGITDGKVMIEIAKIAAAYNGLGLSLRIRDFGITDEKALIEIAKIAATDRKEGLSRVIQNYGITDEKVLIEIAKIAAAHNGADVSRYIENYGIKDEEARIEIAKIAAAQNGEMSTSFFKNYMITDSKATASIYLIANLQAQGKVRPFHQFSKNLESAFKLLNQEKIDVVKVFESLTLFTNEKQWILPEKIVDKIKNVQNPMVQKNLSLWLSCFLGHCENENVSPEQFQFLIQSGLLESILSYPDPKMRNLLMSSLISLTTDKTKQDYVADLLKLKKPPHTKVPMLLLAKLHAEGVSKETCDAQFKIVSHVTFKQGKNLKVYMNALYAISNSSLKPEEKEYLLKSIRLENILSTLGAIKTLDDLGKVSELNKENLEKLSISKILESNVKELIPVKETADFGEKFANYFGENRVPNFIFTYAAKLHLDRELNKCLGYIVDGILDGEFQKMRYDLTKSEHLSKVFSENQEFFEKWKTGASGKLVDFLSTTSADSKPLDFRELLEENFFLQGHLDQEDAPLLFDFLSDERSLESIEEEHLKDPNNKILNIQKNTAKLTDKKLSVEETKELLKAIESDLKEVVIDKPRFAEFHRDIKGFLSSVIKQNPTQDKYNKFSIVDTDNYEDLFLLGTEVAGSCQVIDGDLSMNKCLMGYVLDGKNRLLAVKDENGRIMARHIFRILLDENDKPVLFMEVIYPKVDVVDPKLREGLEAFAKKRAEDLGLPLLSEDPNKPEYGGSIRSISTLNPVPFEYADAGTVHVTGGKYRIPNPSFV